MRLIFWVALFASTVHLYAKDSTSSKLTTIEGISDLFKEGDTVTMHISKYGNFYADENLHKTYTTTVNNSRYKFSFSISIPVYFTIQKLHGNSKINFVLYLIKPGDSVLLKNINSDSIQFFGKGAHRLKLQYCNRKIDSKWSLKITGWDTTQIFQTFEILDSCSDERINHLTLNKKILGEELYTILIADIVGESGLKFEYRVISYNADPRVAIWRRILLNYKDPFWKKYNRFDAQNQFLKYSYVYAKALISKYKWDSCVVAKRPFNLIDCYDFFRLNLKGGLREKVIATLLYDNKSNSEDFSFCLRTALNYVSSPDFRNLLQKLENNLQIGSVAYKFRLPDTNGGLREFSEFQGKVVLLDFWFTGCIGCLQLKPKMDSIIELFANTSIVFISISVDKSKDVWLNSIKKNLYTSERNINLYTEGKGNIHPVISHYLIKEYPSLLLIDKMGKLCEYPLDPRIDNGTSLINLINRTLD